MLRIAVVVLLLAGIVSCNEAVQETSNTDTPAARSFRSSEAAPAEKTAEPVAEVESLAGSMVKAASGEEIEVISVGTFDTKTKELAGMIALEGRVSKVFAERGAFMIVDFEQMDGCQDSCCPATEIPVRLAIEEYEGDLPAVDDVVILVADLTLTDTGYNLEVAEVQRAGEAILTKTV